MLDVATKGFELVEYLPDYAVDIIRRGATEPGLVCDERSLQFAAEAADNGPCMAGLFDGVPVSCGGFEILRPGFAEIWMLNVFDIAKYHIDPQVAKDWIYEKIAEHKFFRVQTPLRSDYPAGEAYTKWLGFKFEGKLECYHYDGSDALMYALINK